MSDQNIRFLKDMLDGLSEYYQREKLSSIAMRLYFSALEEFDIQSIKNAINVHLKNPSGGQYYPKIADLLEILRGGEVTTDQIIAAARLKSTPLGVLCRIRIGSHDLDNPGSPFYLKQRAEECLQLLPEWKLKAIAGSYTDHELSVMIKHRVNPLAPLHEGLPAPEGHGITLLQGNLARVAESQRHEFLLGKSEPENLLYLEHVEELPPVSESERESLLSIVNQLKTGDRHESKRAEIHQRFAGESG